MRYYTSAPRWLGRILVTNSAASEYYVTVIDCSILQEKENRGASPEKQVDQEVREESGTKFSSLFKNLKNPSKIGRTMSENLSVPLAFIGRRFTFIVNYDLTSNSSSSPLV